MHFDDCFRFEFRAAITSARSLRSGRVCTCTMNVEEIRTRVGLEEHGVVNVSFDRGMRSFI